MPWLWPAFLMFGKLLQENYPVSRVIDNNEVRERL